MQWQPIETAPKDGTRFLVYARIEPADRRFLPNHFYAVAWFESGGQRHKPFLKADFGAGHYGPKLDEITHWMPLPEPPA